MNKPIFGWVVAACACAPAATLAANGSVPTARVRDAAARRLEAQAPRVERTACETVRRELQPACMPGANPREPVKKT